jgi:hypothetical protein
MSTYPRQRRAGNGTGGPTAHLLPPPPLHARLPVRQSDTGDDGEEYAGFAPPETSAHRLRGAPDGSPPKFAPEPRR